MAFFNPAAFPIGAKVRYLTARMDVDATYNGAEIVEWTGVVSGECDLDHNGRAISVPLLVKRVGKADATYQVPMEDVEAVEL